MKCLPKLMILLLFVPALCACVPQETTDVVTFCLGTKTPQEAALRLTDCLLEREAGELRCFWSLEQGVSLRVLCTEDGQIAECRVLLRRLNADGSAFAVTQARTQAFCALTARVCGALQEITPQETGSLLETLRSPGAFDVTSGESEVFRGKGFSAVLVHNGAESALRVCNRWLAPLEEKETPESVPAFDATTNIRTQTVPLS